MFNLCQTFVPSEIVLWTNTASNSITHKAKQKSEAKLVKLNPFALFTFSQLSLRTVRWISILKLHALRLAKIQCARMSGRWAVSFVSFIIIMIIVGSQQQKRKWKCHRFSPWRNLNKLCAYLGYCCCCCCCCKLVCINACFENKIAVILSILIDWSILLC